MFGKLLAEFDSRMFQAADKYFRHILGVDLYDIPIVVKRVDNIARGMTGGVMRPIFSKDSSPDKFEIEKIEISIKTLATTIGMIEALAHELVHARQYADGSMGVRFDKSLLLGFIPVVKVVKLWKGNDVTDLPYYEQPSEIEAHLLQKHMTLDFLKKIEDNLEVNTMADLLKVDLNRDDE